MTRMLGRVQPPWCPHCNGEPGPDCPDIGADTRQAKRREDRDVQRHIDQERED